MMKNRLIIVGLWFSKNKENELCYMPLCPQYNPLKLRVFLKKNLHPKEVYDKVWKLKKERYILINEEFSQRRDIVIGRHLFEDENEKHLNKITWCVTNTDVLAITLISKFL